MTAASGSLSSAGKRAKLGPSFEMNGWLYALACVLVPAIWGVAMYQLFEVWDRRRRASMRRSVPPPIDYSI